MRTRKLLNTTVARAVVALLLLQSGPANTAQPTASTITIDLHALSHPFPHFWEQMYGSGRAILSLRESYRNDLRSVRQITGFRYIRFHGILDDDVGVYNEDQSGQTVYNFSYVDQIYDGLLANGIRPFVELSFMPRQLAASPITQAFWYRPYVAPPKTWAAWGDLIQAFARHLIARYGIDEVAQWYFEVWNEPNIDFWAGVPKQSTYFQLYDTAARALKSVSGRLRVGGPATAQAAWVTPFLEHCVAAGVPVDFISTHVYGNDSAKDVFGTDESIPRDQMVPRAVRKVHDQVKASRLPDLPVIFSEYNASYMNEVEVTDSAYMGPWVATTISQCDGLVDILAYWAFSDVFEEQGVVKRPFYGGFGLMAAGNIPKASYNAFKLLHELGNVRLNVDSPSAIATLRADGTLVLAVWNYAPPGTTGAAVSVTISIRGLSGRRRASVQIVDREHGSTLDVWERMGRPDFPSREQQQQLRRAAELPGAVTREIENGSLPLTLNSQSLAVVEVGH